MTYYNLNYFYMLQQNGNHVVFMFMFMYHSVSQTLSNHTVEYKPGQKQIEQVQRYFSQFD